MNMSALLPYLRALYQLYQHAHWKSEGENYYGDHLLFQRLYEDVQEEIDLVAEKIIGVSGETDAVNVGADVGDAAELAKTMLNGDDFVSQSINAEKGLLELISQIMRGDTTDGVEDMLQGIASKHEEHMYLLQQRSKESGILVQLYKMAHELDRLGMYEEASEIDIIMSSMAKRVGIDLSELVSLANYFDHKGNIVCANILDEVLLAEAKKKSKKTSRIPPKKWWDKMEKEISKDNPDYSEERVAKTIGDIWYNNLTDEKRKEIRGREGKKYAFNSL